MKRKWEFALRIMMTVVIVLGTAGTLLAQEAGPAVTLASAPNPSAYGDTVTFTAVVSVGGGTPTGWVYFYELIYTPPISVEFILLGEDYTAEVFGQDSYVYTFSTSSLAVGSHAVMAAYQEAVNEPTVNSEVITQVVNEAVWPTVTITSAPAEVSYSTEATFEFVSDPPGAQFECSLVEGQSYDLENLTWSPCESPHHITGLSYNQAYGFLVRSVGAPVVPPYTTAHQWFVYWPEVTITSGPAEVTESTEATLLFETDPPGAAVDCKLFRVDLRNPGVWLEVHDWTPCTSPRTYTGLSRGSGYLFWVNPTGAPEQAAALRQWVIPKVVLTSSPNPSELGQAVALTAVVWDEQPATLTGQAIFVKLVEQPTFGGTILVPEFLHEDPIGSTSCGPSSCTFTFSTSSLAIGSHLLAAFYREGETSFESLPKTQVVTEAIAQPPAITANPSHQTVCAGANVSFSAAASGTPEPTVQWHVSSDGGATWSAISGATGTIYTFTAAASDHGKRYRAVFTNSAGSATSSAALLTVNTAPMVTTQPSNQTVTYGASSVIFSAAASGTSPSVQWQQTAGGGAWAAIVGATTPNLTVANPTVAMSGTQYRAVFSNMCGTATTNAATLTVNQKAAWVTAHDKSKTYGDDNPALTAAVTGAVTGGDPIDYSLSTAAEKLSNVGDYPIHVTLGSNPNYSVTKTDGTLTIDQKAASVIADDKSKTYGDDNPALTATVTGAVAGGDPIDYALSTTAEKLSDVGDYPIDVTLGSNPNYNVTKADGTLTVNQKAAWVTAHDKSKTYGDDNPALTATVTGAVTGGDPVDYALSTTAEQLSGVGDYPIAVTLGSNPNYNVSKADGTLTVNQKDASVTADDASKTYGDDNPTLTATVTGAVEGGHPINYSLSTTAEKLSGVGDYPIVLTLGSNPNYNVSKTDGTLTIERRAAWVTPDSFTRQYSDANPAFSGALGGFIESDGITAAYDTSATSASAPGNYAIAATLSPQEKLGNYDITYHTGTLTVVKEDATVTFDGGNSVSVQVATAGGNSPSFTLTASVRERTPDLPHASALPGDIGLAGVEIRLVPVGPGSTIVGDCGSGQVTGSGYDAVKRVECAFQDVPVNVYTVDAVVVGDYYTGEPAEDGLVVYDPSLGFTTGGGWFYWPGTADEETGYAGDKTTFGYTMKYNKKATSVQGSLLVIRHLADGTIYRVKSNALQGLALGEDAGVPMGWASFSGSSTYLEPGWPEPKGNHAFTVYVEDRNEPGTGVDRFWISVANGMTMGRAGPDDAVSLQGGNIVVPHKASKSR